MDIDLLFAACFKEEGGKLAQAEGSLASLALLTGLTDVKLPAMELTAAAVQHLAAACHGLRLFVFRLTPS